ncbi:hypothetical protein Syun_031310 [Stephania yunnanensis]|uniref:DNA helicase Pif1-like 2B domain-containing protein n=1 Tax=Stephania yunnanensis TaxID=152371 RepID=A0AAP0DZJ6_9MAGN
MKRIKLVENMRAKLDEVFSKYLLFVGNGVEREYKKCYIKIPSEMIIPYKVMKTSLRQLINHIYGKLNDYANNLDAMTTRAILTTKNEFVDGINQLFIEEFVGDMVKYYSFDQIIDNNEHSVTEEILNSLVFNGIPPHELILKKNCLIMLLRNINPAEGLCNGTRLICRHFERNVIDAEIINGDYKGKRVFLARIPFVPNEGDKCPVQFKRTQFPIRLCFAMTINKAQGQTLDYVRIYLPEPVFSYGQLYVPLSRAKCAASVKMSIKPSNCNKYCDRTKNIVYKDLLKHVDEDD